MGFWRWFFGKKNNAGTRIESRQTQGIVKSKRIENLTITYENRTNDRTKDHNHNKKERSFPVTHHKRIDKSIIIDFDLQILETAFRNALSPTTTGAFGFSIGGMDQHICRQYVMERLDKELRNKCDRPVHHASLCLKNEDIDFPLSVLDRLEKKLGATVPQWFENRPPEGPPEALMVSIWNYESMQEEEIIRECWAKILTEYNSALINQSHTFAVIWISLKGNAIDLDAERFHALELPQQFDRTEIDTHFRQRLKGAGVDDETISNAIEGILEYGGNLLPTYNQISDIIDRLKGAPSTYAY